MLFLVCCKNELFQKRVLIKVENPFSLIAFSINKSDTLFAAFNKDQINNHRIILKYRMSNEISGSIEKVT